MPNVVEELSQWGLSSSNWCAQDDPIDLDQH